MERIKELSILVSLATLRACYRVSRGGCIDRRWIVSPLCVCTLNAIPSFIPTADRTEGGDGKDIFSQSVSWSGMMEFFSFFPLKRTMIFVLFRVENSSSPRDRSTKFIRRSSDVGSLSFGLKIAMRTRGGSSLGTIDGKAKLPIYRRWCVLPSLLSPHFTFRIFYPSRGKVFFLDPTWEHVAEPQNFRAREPRRYR